MSHGWSTTGKDHTWIHMSHESRSKYWKTNLVRTVLLPFCCLFAMYSIDHVVCSMYDVGSLRDLFSTFSPMQSSKSVREIHTVDFTTSQLCHQQKLHMSSTSAHATALVGGEFGDLRIGTHSLLPHPEVHRRWNRAVSASANDARSREDV